MTFTILFTIQASKDLEELENNKGLEKRLKAVRKTYKYKSVKGHNGEEIFEAYAENNTPAAYRIFWHYGPNKDNITIPSSNYSTSIKSQLRLTITPIALF